MARTGFYPAGTMTGAAWTDSVMRIPHGSGDNAVAFGDLVELNGGNANVAYPGTTNIIGVCVGIENPSKPDGGVGNMGTGALNLETAGKLIAANANGYVLCTTAPDILLEGSLGNGTLVDADRGENVDVLYAASTATNPRSKMIIDANTNTSAAAQLRLIDWKRVPGATPNAANATWLVMINEHAFKKTVGSG